jgi:CheY-like chemotaxis protein
MMGGQIWIESETGRGSTFAFTIQARRSLTQKYNSLLPGVDWTTIRVLVVDDAPDIREYFADIAQGFGITCDAASDGEDACGLIERKGAYDIYFIDWKMPGMGGIELSRWIKNRDGNKSVVIMISSTEWSVIEKDAETAGISKFLPKPLFPSMIADCINECLGMAPVRNDQKTEIDDFSGHRILVAEDVDINREILLSLLEPSNLAVDCAENGVEAFKLFSKNHDSYGMIFMDVQMPEMDGYEATRRIRAFEEDRRKKTAPEFFREIPIIAMTANVFREDIEKCLDAGMNGHIGKPLNLDEVLDKLREYLNKNRNYSAAC